MRFVQTRMSARFPSKRAAVRRAIAPVVEALEDRRLFSSGYILDVVAAFGQSLPNAGDGVYTGDFEVGGINNAGQIVFTSDQGKPDLQHDQGQAVFLTKANGGKPFRTLNLSNTPAPGGGTFVLGSLSPDAINDAGDAAFAFILDGLPIYHSGVYRYSHDTGKLTAIVTPGVTKATDGTRLLGASLNPSINGDGDVAFVGVVDTRMGAVPGTGLGTGLFLAHKNGKVLSLVVPGDKGPGGSRFDGVQQTSINKRGDIAFGGHLAADPALGADQSEGLTPYQSVFLYQRGGSILSLARQGTPIPASAGGGWYDVAFSPRVNDRGQVAYTAAISRTKPTGDPKTDDPSKDGDGIFLYSHGHTIAVARPGQLMPGGAHLVRTSFQASQMDLSNKGEVTYNAMLDDGTQGVFVWSKGVTSLVARTGTELPGGAVVTGFDLFGLGYPNTIASNNDKGQVAFGAVLQGGSEALVLATPHGAPTVAPVQAT